MGALKEQLESIKEKNQELEDEISEKEEASTKQHRFMLSLDKKYRELQSRHIKPKEDLAAKKTVEEKEYEILVKANESQKNKLKREKLIAEKTIKELKNEVDELEVKVKETEKENKMNSDKIKELQKKVKHNQLKPIERTESSGGDRKEEQKKPVEQPPPKKKQRAPAKVDFCIYYIYYFLTLFV